MADGVLPIARRVRLHPAPRLLILCGALGTAAVLLTWIDLAHALAPARWWAALAHFDPSDMPALVFAFATLPRVPGALLAGAALGVAGALFQHGLRNSLAVPDTLGVTAGGQLALSVLTLVAPAWLAAGRGLVAFAGGAAAVTLVFGLSWRRGLPPLTVLLTGLVVTLYLGALGTLLMLFHAHDLSGLMLWASGSLDLQDWWPVRSLALGTAALGLAVLAAARPLAMLTLEDATVRGIGGSVVALRGVALGLGLGLCATVTATFGAIDFIGLAAPNLVRLCGVRGFRRRLAWSGAVGALLLWAADAATQRLSDALGADLPTGALTALFGTPLLVWLCSRARDVHHPVEGGEGRPGPRRAALPILAGLALLVSMAGVAAVLIGRGPDGWSLTLPRDLGPVLPWRGPRMVAAGAAGGLLALSGAVLQRAARNAVAAPEMLGLSAGAGFGLTLAVIGFGAGPAVQAATAIAGAGLVAGALLFWGARGGFESARVLVTGLSLATCAGALVGLFGALGDPRAVTLMAWMAGSTARATPGTAVAALAALGLLLPGLFALRRWLAAMPLGAPVARALGVPPGGASVALFGYAAALAGCGTLIVGPLSFVGLVAPHVARLCGLRGPVAQGVGAVLIGAVLMVLADWGGRTLHVPWQLPSGIVAAMIGAPVLLLALRRSGT